MKTLFKEIVQRKLRGVELYINRFVIKKTSCRLVLDFLICRSPCLIVKNDLCYFIEKFGTFCKHALNVLQRYYTFDMFCILGTGRQTGTRTRTGARTRTRTSTGTQTGTRTGIWTGRQTGTRTWKFKVWKKKIG